MSYDSITIPASGYVSLKKNGLSLSNIRMASIITYSRIDPPKPFCVYGNSTVAYVYGEPGTVITELKVRFWYWLNSKSRIIFKDVIIETKKDEFVVFASSTEFPLAVPVIINHRISRNSIDIVSKDSTDWIIYSNFSQHVTIRMYLLNAS